MDNTEFILGIGYTINLFVNEANTPELIREKVKKLVKGYVLSSSIVRFNSGAKLGLELIAELETLRKAAIEHAREAEKESEKAEEVVESVSDSSQLTLPMTEETENLQESGQEFGEGDVDLVSTVAYHASHSSGLTTIKPASELGRKTQYDSYGSWATSDQSHAKRSYGPHVYLVKIPSGRYFSVPKSHGELYYDFFIREPVVRKVRPELGKKFDSQDYFDWLNESDRKKKEESKFNQEVVKPLLFDSEYAKEWSKSWTEDGYKGVVWKDSRIDTIKSDPSHTVYFVFGNLEVIKELS